MRPVQRTVAAAARAADDAQLYIVEAPMGEGKTEAALLAAEIQAQRHGLGGCFIALPTMATSDAMFRRVNDWVTRLGAQRTSIFLAHGKAALNDDFQGLVCDDFGADYGRPCVNQTLVPGDIPVDTKVWDNNPDARREYQAVNLLFDYRPTTRLQLGGNYTYSTLEGNYEGEGENTPAAGSPLGDFPRAMNVAAAAPFGNLASDIRHRASLFGNYLFNFGRAGDLSIGSLLYYQSGFNYSLAANVAREDVPEYVSEAGDYTFYFGDRGGESFNDWWTLDLSARYEVNVFSDIGLFLKASVLNVLDNDEVTSFLTTGRAVEGANGQLTWQPVGNCGPGDEPSRSCTGFGRIRNEDDYQDPRTFVFAVGIDF
jgi:hypothetical protein